MVENRGALAAGHIGPRQTPIRAGLSIFNLSLLLFLSNVEKRFFASNHDRRYYRESIYEERIGKSLLVS